MGFSGLFPYNILSWDSAGVMWKLVLVTLLAAHGDISLGHPLFEATESQSPLAPPSEIILHSSSTEGRFGDVALSSILPPANPLTVGTQPLQLPSGPAPSFPTDRLIARPALLLWATHIRQASVLVSATSLRMLVAMEFMHILC